jgi:hypothetical protein
MIEFLVWSVIFATYFAVSAGMFWLRGSAVFEQITGRGKTTGDLVWAVSMALLAAPLYWNNPTSPIGAFALLTFAFFLGGRLPWWRSLSMGRDPRDGSFWGAFARHTVRGLFWVAPAAFVFGILGTNPMGLLLAGLQAGFWWEAGWRMTESDKKIRLGATELGEIFFGAAIGGAIFGTVIGFPSH